MKIWASGAGNSFGLSNAAMMSAAASSALLRYLMV
jgi:hypothetical protein